MDKIQKVKEMLDSLTEDELLKVIRDFLMTPGEVIEFLNISYNTLSQWQKRHKITTIKRGVYLQKSVLRMQHELENEEVQKYTPPHIKRLREQRIR